MTFSELTSNDEPCPCGCGNSIRLLSGRFEYQAPYSVAFRAALHGCEHNDPHVWTQLGSGPWNPDDGRNCWVTLHTWIDDKELRTSVTDHTESPFTQVPDAEQHMLTRAEVMDHADGKEWTFQVNDLLIAQHQEISALIMSQTIK